MGLIQDAIRKWRNKKAEKEDYEREQRIMEGYEQRKLSADERELIRWEEQERQKRIKAALKSFRERENEEVWSGKKGNPVFTPNVIAGQKELFKGDENLFMKKSNFFDQPDLFFGK